MAHGWLLDHVFAKECLNISFVCCGPLWQCGLANVVLCLTLVLAMLHVLDANESIQTLFLRSIDVKLGKMDFEASLIIMNMQEYDVILWMDWLAQYSVVVDYAKKTVVAECPRQGWCLVQGVRPGGPRRSFQQ